MPAAPPWGILTVVVASSTRRRFLRQGLVGLGALGAGHVLGCEAPRGGGSSHPGPRREPVTTPTATVPDTMPVTFVGHGAPTLALDPGKGAPFVAWAAALPRPRALLVVSAHWEREPASLGTVETRPLMYDFGGFPPPLYQVQYPAPGAPELAERVAALFGPGTERHPTRALDHGVWTPLVHMYPDADVPVLQLSLPSRWSPRELFEYGRALAPLRAEGVLIVGSGSITHNLRRIGREGAAPEAWASEFDAWTQEVLSSGDLDRLVAYREAAPALRMTHPTEEHFQPLLVAAGAASDGAHAATYPVTGFEYQNLSRRCVQLG